jgi:heme exporter protein D
MTHLPFVAASYGLAALAILFFSVSSVLRLRRAERRLRVLDIGRGGR